MRNRAEIFNAVNLCHTISYFDILSFRFRKKEIVRYFLKAFYTKIRFPQVLLPDMKLLKKFFTIIVMKNAN